MAKGRDKKKNLKKQKVTNRKSSFAEFVVTIMPDNFDVLKTMCDENQKILLAPLDNIVNVQMTKRGLEITIGTANVTINDILEKRFVGGLLLADKTQFQETKKRLTNKTP